MGPVVRPGSPVDQVVSAADAMRVTGTKGSMTAEVAYSRQLGKGAITVTGMPPAPDGKVYQLWYVGADGVARSAGIMAPEDGRGAMVLEGDPNNAAAVGVTVEPAGGSPSPTTEPVVVLPLRLTEGRHGGVRRGRPSRRPPRARRRHRHTARPAGASG